MTINASEKRKWSTVTCASCGQLFFGDCSLKSPEFPPLQKERRDDLPDRGGRCQSFSISNRLEIHIHHQTKEPFGAFPFEPIACINAGYAGSSRPVASAHSRRGQLQLCIHPGPILSYLEAHILHTSNKPFHKTRLLFNSIFGKAFPNWGDSIYSMKGN